MSIAMKQMTCEVRRVIFKNCPLKYPVQKLLSTQYCCDRRRVCKCSAPLKVGPERFQEAYPENQGHRIILPFFFLEIVILRFVSRAIWQIFDETRLSPSKNLHSWNFLKSRNIESCTIMVSSIRRRNSVSNLEGFWKAGSEEVLIYIVQKWLQLEKACTGFSATVLLHTVYIPASFFFLSLSFCPAQQCMKQQTRLEVTQL